MSIFDVKNNKAICVLPWVHEFKQMSGDLAPCCHGSQLDKSETLDIIRKQMLEGIKPRACGTCYINEKESGYSPRIHETISWINRFGEPDVDNPVVQFLDVRHNPTCNLKCKTCGPEFSTLWQKEKKISFMPNKDNESYLNAVDKKSLRKVYLAGGEPTYIKEYITFLNALYEKNPECEVMVNTNLKNLSDQWKEIIKKFKNLTLVCSCDSIDLLGRYVRYPLDWATFEKNVKFVSENANYLQFNLVASNLTTHKIHETCSWMKQYSKNINICIISNPEYFSERAVPLQQREAYIQNIKKLEKFPVSAHFAINFRSKIKHLAQKYKDSDYDRTLHQKLSQEILEQDRNRTLCLEDVDRFLFDWIHK